MKLEYFPNIYTGKKNCFDCKNFKIKIPVRKSGFIKYNNGKVKCTKGFILRHPKKSGNVLREPVFSFSSNVWNRVEKNGWRHEEWGVANVCDNFESML